jgi:acetyl esterase
MLPTLQHPRPMSPQVASLVSRVLRAGRAPYWQGSPEAAHAFHEKASQVLEIAKQPVGEVQDLSIPVGQGAQIAARLYNDLDAASPAPLVIFSHGGGFMVGSIDSYDALCRMLAVRAGCKVLSLEYRMSPAYRFPTAANDVFGAWQWAFHQAETLGVDVHRIVGMGDSAGGTLVAQAALRARDARLPLAGQVLVYPGTCAWQDTPSHQAYAEGYLLDARTVQWFFSHYLRDDQDRLDWRFSVLDAPALDSLPPTLIQLAECDPLVDEGIAYANRLMQAGTRVDATIYPGTVHAFYNMGGALAAAREAHADTVRWLRARWGLPD